MKYLIIGSGGREHAIYWRLKNDGSASKVYAAPGNGGIEDKFRIDVKSNDFKAITKICGDKKIDVVVVGPEDPLSSGIIDHLSKEKIPAFGPSREAAMLEGSKLFAKTIMEKYNIPTAAHREFRNRSELLNFIEDNKKYPLVIKLDGLAAGKGVSIPETKKDALDFINANVKQDAKVFIEDYIEGEEISLLGISDGEHITPLIAAQDHKRIFDGDKGPNTGGMGAYSPAPLFNKKYLEKAYDHVLKPAIMGMNKEDKPFKGVLYAGLIINGDDMKVLEFNARFGDPETQVILPLLKTKLGDIIDKSINGNLKNLDIRFSDQYAVTVVIASAGYPGAYEKGKEISGIDKLSDDIIVFHAGTESKNGKLITNGGRVLNVTASGSDLVEARNRIYIEIDKIKFEGAYYRKDIGHRALKYFGA